MNVHVQVYDSAVHWKSIYVLSMLRLPAALNWPSLDALKRELAGLSTWCATTDVRFKAFTCNLKVFPLAWKIYPLIQFTELLALCITSRGFIDIFVSAEMHSHPIRQVHVPTHHEPQHHLFYSLLLILLLLPLGQKATQLSWKGTCNISGALTCWDSILPLQNLHSVPLDTVVTT